MQEYLQRSRVGDFLDSLGIRVLLAVGCFGWFLMLWGLRLSSLSAGMAFYVLCLMLYRKRQDARVKRREKRLRERIGGELALEKMCLQDEKTSHFQIAVLLSLSYPLTLEQVTDDGVICHMEGKKLLVAFRALPPGDQADARQVLSLQRQAVKLQADKAVLCVSCGVSPEAYAQAEGKLPVTLPDRESLIALLGRQNPATDEDLLALAKRKKRQVKPGQWLRFVLLPGRSRRYLLYGLMLVSLYILTGFFYYLMPGILCLLLSAGCRLFPPPRPVL